MNEELVDQEAVEEVTEDTPAELVDMSAMSDSDFEEYVSGRPEEVAVEAPEELSEETSEEGDTNALPHEEDAIDTEVTAPEVEFSKEAAYDEIMAEFKANGKMMTVDTVADVRQLMMMGAGFNKKTTDLKKDIKFIKMLESNDLLSEDKLNYLIDLSKKDKGAIQQLIKDGEFGLDDLDVSGESVYTPNSYTVSDERAKLDSVLESLQDSPAYATTIDLVGIKWDKASREALAAEPNDIRVINGHIENGIYEQINEVVEREKMMGRLDNLSDYQAYRKVGDAMNARGMFNAPAAPIQSQAQDAPNGRRAAAPTTSTSARPEGKSSMADMVNMSDEEFVKLYG